MNHSDRIPYRIFWTWDHSTNWCMHEKGSQNSGVANPYTKQPEFFEMDYRRAVDWCASHGMDAVGIVGLLRDSHGGVDSVRRLCGYARERGIRIYAIAGLYAYGGIYYEGDHPYSLNRYFEKNPGAVGKQEDGSPLIVTYRGRMGYKDEPQGCPSDPALNDSSWNRWTGCSGRSRNWAGSRWRRAIRASASVPSAGRNGDRGSWIPGPLCRTCPGSIPRRQKRCSAAARTPG